MSKSTITHKRIDKNTLIKTFKRFKNQPKKVFVVTEFSRQANIFRSQYLRTLIVLGLIEEVSAIYHTGDKIRRGRREVKGYRLKKLILEGLEDKK